MVLDTNWALDKEFARWHRKKKYSPSRGHNTSKEGGWQAGPAAFERERHSEGE